VVGAEELDWIVADAVRLFDRSSIYAGGAGALYLKRDSDSNTRLDAVTDSFLFTQRQNRNAARLAMRSQLGSGSAGELLCDNETSEPVGHAWPGPRLTLQKIVGEAYSASAAWQCVMACDAIREQQAASAAVSIVGANQQAIGARFIRAAESN
jgi:hypothetical protein